MGLHGFGYQDNVNIEDHMFTVHTGYDPDKGLAISEVFDEGKFIYASHHQCNIRKSSSGGIDEKYIKKVARELHNQVIDDIRIFFYIHEKIKVLRRANPHYRLGKIFFVYKFDQEAIDNFERAIQLNPKILKAYKLLALIYLKQKNYDRARELLEQAHTIEPDFPDIMNCLGVIYTHAGQYEKARNILQTALKIKEDFPEANFNLGILLFLSTLKDNKDEQNVVLPARILRTFKQIREHESYDDRNWQDLFAYTSQILSSGERSKVIDALKALQLKLVSSEQMNITMDSFFLKFMYGGKELRQEELEKFEEIFQKEKDQFSKRADYWNELGIIHLIQCRDYFLKALKEFERATTINPKYKAALNSLELMKHGKKGFLILLRAILK